MFGSLGYIALFDAFIIEMDPLLGSTIPYFYTGNKWLHSQVLRICQTSAAKVKCADRGPQTFIMLLT